MFIRRVEKNIITGSHFKWNLYIYEALCESNVFENKNKNYTYFTKQIYLSIYWSMLFGAKALLFASYKQIYVFFNVEFYPKEKISNIIFNFGTILSIEFCSRFQKLKKQFRTDL